MHESTAYVAQRTKVAAGHYFAMTYVTPALQVPTGAFIFKKVADVWRITYEDYIGGMALDEPIAVAKSLKEAYRIADREVYNQPHLVARRRELALKGARPVSQDPRA